MGCACEIEVSEVPRRLARLWRLGIQIVTSPDFTSFLGWNSMRSIGLLAAVIGTLLLGSGCSDGAGTTPPDNTAPVANFAVPACILDVPCDFASTSTDDAEVTQWSWDFDGDGNSDAITAAASYRFTTAADYNVSLIVRDAQGLSDTMTSTVTVDPAPVNTPPTADFTQTCNALECTFVNASSDVAPGTIATYAWTFGDGATADLANPSHTYAVTAATDFTVTLTVTDNDGATDAATRTITVTPAAPVNPPTAGFTHTLVRWRSAPSSAPAPTWRRGQSRATPGPSGTAAPRQ